jgi:cbb3-type cytochrome oxidase subunit 1
MKADQRGASVAYFDTPVRWFALAAVLWGVVGMLVGVIIAAQLAWPELNFGIPWLSYGRLRPLRQRHTGSLLQVACAVCNPGMLPASSEAE